MQTETQRLIGTIQWSVRKEDYFDDPGMYYNYCIEARLSSFCFQQRISNYMIHMHLRTGYVFLVAAHAQKQLLRKVGK